MRGGIEIKLLAVKSSLGRMLAPRLYELGESLRRSTQCDNHECP